MSHGLDAIAAGTAHGDLQPSNVIVGDDSVGLIDWEYLCDSVPIGFDLLFLVSEVTRLMVPPEPLDANWRVARPLVPAVRAFLSESGLGETLLRGYVPLFVATRQARAATLDRIDRPRAIARPG
jgi:Ser/Thr protein kinase RdoA (MazF antagonist)